MRSRRELLGLLDRWSDLLRPVVDATADAVVDLVYTEMGEVWVEELHANALQLPSATVPLTDEIPLATQLFYSRLELEKCQEVHQEQPVLSRDGYAKMMAVKEAVIRTLERLVQEEAR